MINDADISENQFLHSYGEKVCMNLLKDHTTQQNIYWATDSYADYGEDFTFFAPITLDKIILCLKRRQGDYKGAIQ